MFPQLFSHMTSSSDNAYSTISFHLQWLEIAMSLDDVVKALEITVKAHDLKKTYSFMALV